MKKIIHGMLIAAGLFCALPAAATEMVYTPINPSFGGNSMNGTFLMSQAEAQNTHKDPSLSSSYSRDPLESFEESLTRRILSNLAGSIVESTFGYGDSELSEGFYQVGDYEIEVTGADTGDVSVTITDDGTGNQTTIVIPSTLGTGL